MIFYFHCYLSSQISIKVFRLLSDQQREKFVPALGDRIQLCGIIETKLEKNDLLRSVGERLHGNRSLEQATSVTNSASKRQFMTVHVGLKHKGKNDTGFTKVKREQGGDLRKLTLNVDCGTTDIINESRSEFFDEDGWCEFGHYTTMNFALGTVSNKILNHEFRLSHMKNVVNPKLYLCISDTAATKKRKRSTINNVDSYSDDDDNDVSIFYDWNGFFLSF